MCGYDLRLFAASKERLWVERLHHDLSDEAVDDVQPETFGQLSLCWNSAQHGRLGFRWEALKCCKGQQTVHVNGEAKPQLLQSLTKPRTAKVVHHESLNVIEYLVAFGTEHVIRNLVLHLRGRGDEILELSHLILELAFVHRFRLCRLLQLMQLALCFAMVPTYDKSTFSSTRQLCSLLVNLNAVPLHLFSNRRGANGKSYQRLDYQLGMQLDSGGLKFDLRVDGVVYGNITATFDYY